jgi:hypothetical protein
MGAATMTEGPGWAAPDPQPEPPPTYYQPAPPPPPGWGVPKPGVIPLRPLSLSEILDGAISTMRAHPKVILGVSAIVVTISQLLTTLATWPLIDDLNRAKNLGPNPTGDELSRALGATFGLVGISVLIAVLVRVFLAGFLTIAVGKAVLGQPVTSGEVWARVRPRLLALLGLTLVFPAVALVAVVLVVVVALAAGAVAILLGLALFVISLWLYILFSLATPALMLESAGIRQAFGRSRTLVRGSWWRVFGITLLAGIIASIVALIIVAPFTLLSGGFSTSAVIDFKYLALTTIGGIIASTLTEPFAAGVSVLLYTDQRMRREGMDIELARAAGLTPPYPL